MLMLLCVPSYSVINSLLWAGEAQIHLAAEVALDFLIVLQFDRQGQKNSYIQLLFVIVNKLKKKRKQLFFIHFLFYKVNMII